MLGALTHRMVNGLMAFQLSLVLSYQVLFWSLTLPVCMQVTLRRAIRGHLSTENVARKWIVTLRLLLGDKPKSALFAVPSFVFVLSALRFSLKFFEEPALLCGSAPFIAVKC